VRSETGPENAAELLGLIALDGMAVARNALERLAHDPSRANEKAERELVRIRAGQQRLEQAFDNLAAVIGNRARRASGHATRRWAGTDRSADRDIARDRRADRWAAR
jgi:hypothetical protein